jgi:ABC-type Fe3+-hydroxamate transport system substrate-binding protein
MSRAFLFSLSSKTFIDQLGNRVAISVPPQRIISLVPSQTELLADLGLSNEVVGITKFCVHPSEWKKTKTNVGGTKKFDFNLIRSLKPDLIIGNKEENYLEGIQMLSAQYPVWMSEIVTLTDALSMINKVGQITNMVSKASEIATGIESSFGKLNKLPPVRTVYLIWKKPWMAAAPGTFIHEMMQLSGLENCFTTQTRYPELNTEQLNRLNPALILLSSEPYPFKEKDIQELKELCPDAKIVLVDGEMFSWYGSRLLKFPAYLESLRKILS